MNEAELVQKGKELVALFRRKWWMWIPVTLVTTLGAITFALVKEKAWEATQTMIIRDEAAGQLSGQGRFESMDTMKAAQEMVVEVARNFNVLEKTLQDAGPEKPPAGRNKSWPSLRDVEDFRKAVSVSPPHGAEFGTTEVLHLSVEGGSPERAIELTNLLASHLDRALKDLRSRRAAGVIQERQDAADLAQANLENATRRLEDLEREVGSDLGELRKLNEAHSSDGNLQFGLNQIKQQIRETEAEIAKLQEQQRLLREAHGRPDKIIAMPSPMLDTQPALRRLKDGLVDTQLRTSELMGRMSEEHPLVKAALASESEVRANIRAEVSEAISGIDAELKIQRTRLHSIAAQEGTVRDRLHDLAGMRAQYSNLIAEVVQANQLLQEAQQKLAEARANQKASVASSVITMVDGPTVGEDPLGPGKTIIVLAGLCGGLMIGGGLVWLTTPTAQPKFGRRWTDQLWGRRGTDQTAAGAATTEVPPGAIPGGRRMTDPVPIAEAAPRLKPPGNEIRERRSGGDRRQTDRRTSEPAPAESPSHPVG